MVGGLPKDPEKAAKRLLEVSPVIVSSSVYVGLA